MDPVVKKKWIEALRSGKYRQAKGRLRYIEGTSPTHCCLGVLCDLYVQENPDQGNWGTNGNYPNTLYYDGYFEELGLPPKIQEWSGISDPIGTYERDDTGMRKRALAWDNDDGKSFEDIADIIEKKL